MESLNKETINIKNEMLSVEIAVPGTIYNGSRFDWNGFITQVTLDGVHTFCVPESFIKGQGTNGNGLCGEFGIQEPIGYDEAAVGSYFPKIGVGNILKSDDSDYDFFKSYDFTPYNTMIKRDENSVKFCVEPINCNGYALIYEKKISIEASRIKVEYYLRNIGKKTVHTTEYCHNFIRIDGEKVGSGYTLGFPYSPVIDNFPPQMDYTEDESLTWKDEGWEDAFYAVIKGYKQENCHSWDLYNHTRGVGIREYNDFKPARIALWGMRHVISPEIFIDINLKPEEELNWTRSYEFYKKI